MLRKILKDFTTKSGHRAIILEMHWKSVKHNNDILIPPTTYNNGYIIVETDNPYDYVVHGGITFYGELDFADNRKAIGFDCHHSCDKTKEEEENGTGYPDAYYKDVNFVTKELEELGQQLLEEDNGIYRATI